MKNSKFVIEKLARLFELGLVSSKDLGNELKCNLNGKHQWFLDGIAIENGNDINYNINKEGIYEVQVINEMGCILNSEPLEITFRKGTLKSD